MENEQKLIDIAFSLVLTATNGNWMKNKSNLEKAEWVAGQLRQCGFDTVPMGASWGVLKHG